MFVRFFIRRPIFATALAILITLAGAVSIPLMPVDQYPDITPPTIQVTANYDGAGAEATLLVFLVIIAFLKSWRATLIPGITIPVSLIGTFALTIACAVGISALNALTLSPAMCALFLRPGAAKGRFSAAFDRGFEAMTGAYERGLGRLLKLWLLVLLVFAALIALTVYVFEELPRSFVPSEDQGYLLTNVQLPEGASLERTQQVADALAADFRTIPGVAHTLSFAGYSFVSSVGATNLASVIPIFAHWQQRTTQETQIGAITDRVKALFPKYPQARVAVFNPPAVHGLSQTGGFQFELKALSGGDLQTLADDLLPHGYG